MLFLVLLVSTAKLCAQQQVIEVYINGAVPSTYKVQVLEKRIQHWISAINNYEVEKNRLLNEDFESTVIALDFEKLMKITAMKVVSPVVSAQIVQLANGTLEIRNIYVVIEDGNKQQERELVLVVNPSYKIQELRFAIGFERYREIINGSENVLDTERRKRIIAYLEHFRTAYNRKDAEYLRQQFSDEALIIVGSRVRSASNEIQRKRYQLKQNSDEYKLTKLSKSEYIDHLEQKIFKLNANLDVQFKDIKILSHPDYPEIYGVNLYQEWNSSTYSDTGYLYIIIDFENDSQPLIHVRAWQKDLFEDESTFDFSFFSIIK
jgi:hypothetical protein